MSDLPAGPYKTISTPEGLDVPYYLIPFDKRGVCEGPATRAALLDDLRRGAYSHVILFSHGWNNDWTVATERYQHFIDGFLAMRRARDLPLPDGYEPILIGVFWPSTALVFGADEKGPDIAAGAPPTDEEIGEQQATLRELASGLSVEDANRFFELTQRPELSGAEAEALADLAARLITAADDEVGDEPPSAGEVLAAWNAWAPAEPGLDDFGTLDAAAPDSGPEAAGIFSKLDPRKLVRMLTVYTMKDRAGAVGSHGVGPLLRDVLAATAARVHLIGHSFGGKVVLSATGFGGDLPRQVDSMLLLQPAVSHLCFAAEVPGAAHPGGYRPALSRVRQPILSTFSKHDVPLTKTFHLALRRKKDLGEVAIAAGEPPSRYAALGGFGPRGAGEHLIDIRTPRQLYDLDPAVEVYGLRGDDEIRGHGDISNEATWWTLYQQLGG